MYREKIGDTNWDIQEITLDVFDDVRLWGDNPRLIPFRNFGIEPLHDEDEVEAILTTTPGYPQLKRSIKEVGQLEPIYVWRKDAGKFLVFEGATRVAILRELARSQKDPHNRYRIVKAKVLPPDFDERDLVILLAKIHVRGTGVRSWGRYIEAQYVYDATMDNSHGRPVLSVSELAKWMGKSDSWVSRLRTAYGFAQQFVEYLDTSDAQELAFKNFSILEEIAKSPGFGPLIAGPKGDEALRNEVFEMVKRGVFKEYRDARFMKDFFTDKDKWAQLKTHQPEIANRLAAEIKVGGGHSVHGKIAALRNQITKAVEQDSEELVEDDVEVLKQCTQLLASRIVNVSPFRLALQEFVKTLFDVPLSDVKSITRQEYDQLTEGIEDLTARLAKHSPWWATEGPGGDF